MKYRFSLLICFLFTFANKASAFQKTIPFTFYKNKIIVKVVIEKKAYNFVFDTGAMSLIDTSIVNLKKDSKTNISFEVEDASSKTSNLGAIQIANVKLGKVNFKKGYFGLIDFSFINQQSCIPLAGIMGSNFMNNLVWKIDFSAQEIILSNTPFNDNNYKSVDFVKEKYSSVPSSKLTVRGKEVEFIWDTGSNSGLTLNDSILTQIADKSKITVKGFTSVTLFGLNQGQYDLDTMCIGFNTPENNFSVCGVQVDGGKDNIVLLGIDFLKNYSLVLDYINNRVYLKIPDNSSKNSVKFEFIKWGFKLINHENKLIIGNIYDVAEINKSLQPGDIIIQVDNINTKNLDNKNWCNIQNYLENKTQIILRKEDGTEVKIVKSDFAQYFGKL